MSSSFPLSHVCLGALASQIDAAVVVEDSLRRVGLANQLFCDWFGIGAPPRALVGMDCGAAARQSAVLFVDPDRFLRGIELRLAERVSTAGDRLTLLDGRELERDYLPIWVEDQYEGHVWIYRDVTHQRASEVALARAAEAHERFLDHLDHELRSPLSALMSATAELAQRSPAPETLRLLEVMEAAGAAIRYTVEETRARALLVNGPVPLEPSATALPDLVRAVAAIHTQSAESRGLQLDVSLTVSDCAYVSVDAGRLRQLLSNLVGNAIRYSHRGRVVLALVAAPGPTGIVEATFDVVDSGCGIPAERVPRLFDPYWRAEPRNDGGMGLGLYLCKRIADAMGGSLELVSTGPSGSLFRLSLRLPGVAAGGDRGEEPARHSLRDWSIVVAEDDPALLRLLVFTLEEAGARVIACRSCAELRARAAEGDLLLCDVHLADGDTPALVASLRGGRSGPPVVFLSGGESADAQRVGEIPGARWLQKPVVGPDLLAALAELTTAPTAG